MNTVSWRAPEAKQIEGANFLNVLVVDDEPAIRDSCCDAARSLGFNAFFAESAEIAYRQLEVQNADIVLLDLRLPGTSGLQALHEIKERRPEAVVIVVTGFATVQSAVEAMKNGAYDYVTKPFSMDELRLLLDRVAAHLKLKSENRMLREKVKSRQGFAGIIGAAPEMEKLYRILAKAAHSTHPVLILGESGTGKELVARSIHFSGPYREKPFIPVDCGSLVPTLIESELLVTSRVRSPGLCRARMDCWPSPRAARCFWMKWESCRLTCKPNCSAPSRKRKFVLSAAPSG